ncbi:MAG: hypothetical protein WKF83_11845 [Nocardioidaceae bacterium]
MTAPSLLSIADPAAYAPDEMIPPPPHALRDDLALAVRLRFPRVDFL